MSPEVIVPETISPLEAAALKEAQQEACLLLDVRTPAEHAEVHVDGVRLVPLDKLDPAGLARPGDGRSDSCVVICRAGTRARRAAQKLRAAGWENVSVLEGGMQAWEAAGLPVRRSGRKMMSLERQTRIAIGCLVLLGAALGWLVHPAWYGWCAFMGAGLIFSGITDFCGLALILARAPWNR